MAKKKKKRSSAEVESELERAFYLYWKQTFPDSLPAREYRFHPTRKFRLDFAWPMSKVAVEIQGMGPGHCSLPGMTADYEKNLEALLLNWKIVYLTSTQIKPRYIKANCAKIAKLLSLKPPPTSLLPQKSKLGYIPLKDRK